MLTDGVDSAPPALSGAAATAWLTLAARARAAAGGLEGFDDPCACTLAADLAPELLAQVRDDAFVRGVVLRAQWFDAATRAFLDAHDGASAVTLGAGFCTRWSRLRPRLARPAGVHWLNVDQPAVVAWRRRLMPAASGEHELEASLLCADEWLAAAALGPGRPLLLLLEGVCPYVEQAPLEELLRRLADALAAHGAPVHVLLDFVHPALTLWKLRVGETALPVVSGFESVARLAGLHPALRVVEATHPYARFSEAHRRLDDTFRALAGEPPYTLAHLAIGAS